MCRFGDEWQAAVLSLCVQACAHCVSFFSCLPREPLFKHIHYCDNRLNLQFTICLNNINLHATFYYYCLALSEIQNPPNTRWRDSPCTWHHLFYYTHIHLESCISDGFPAQISSCHLGTVSQTQPQKAQ